MVLREEVEKVLAIILCGQRKTMNRVLITNQGLTPILELFEYLRSLYSPTGHYHTQNQFVFGSLFNPLYLGFHPFVVVTLSFPDFRQAE